MRRKIDYLDRNQEHRIKRSDALFKAKPGEKVMVDGIEYSRPKQACVNCSKLGWRKSEHWCEAFHKRIKDIVVNMNDCQWWDFNNG